MILTGSEIRAARAAGDVHISPFDSRRLNPNSYDYRLAADLIELRPVEPDAVSSGPDNHEPTPVAMRRSYVIGREGFVLLPGRLYLGRTFERIGSDACVTTLIGKSSMGRLGLFLQVDACLGHQGIAHQWTLELCVRTPLRVYAEQVIGQVSFWTTQGARMPYAGKYGRRDEPTPNGSATYVALAQ